MTIRQSVPEYTFSVENNSVSIPVAGGIYPGDRHDSPVLTINIVWENGDSDIVRLPRAIMEELYKTIKWLKSTHPAYKGKIRK